MLGLDMMLKRLYVPVAFSAVGVAPLEGVILLQVQAFPPEYGFVAGGVNFQKLLPLFNQITKQSAIGSYRTDPLPVPLGAVPVVFGTQGVPFKPELVGYINVV